MRIRRNVRRVRILNKLENILCNKSYCVPVCPFVFFATDGGRFSTRERSVFASESRVVFFILITQSSGVCDEIWRMNDDHRKTEKIVVAIYASMHVHDS